MPLSDRFFCFEGGRIKQVTLTVRDLGTQNDMIRSLMRPAPFVLRDFTCLAYEAIRNKTASLGIYDPKTNTTKDTEVRLFGRRNPIIAASEQAIVGCFPIATLPLFTRLGPDHNPVADTPALTRVLLLKGSNVLDHPQLIETTVLLPMPPETWITFTANKAGAYWTLTAGTMEVYSAQGMRTPALVNVFDNSKKASRLFLSLGGGRFLPRSLIYKANYQVVMHRVLAL